MDPLKILTSKRQVFLLHFAGGSCNSFDFLRSFIVSDLEFIPLEIPGRGNRSNESFLKTKSSVVEDYVCQIKARRNGQPYLVYGHSMGASLGLSVVKKLEDHRDPPRHLIVSGNPGPGIREDDGNEMKRRRSLLNDDDFKEELRALGGVPTEVLENDELYNFFSPIMRADFEVVENDVAETEVTLSVPIYALMGSDEKSNRHIDNWSRFTSGNFTSEILPGGHFFIRNHPGRLAAVIMSCYERRVNICTKRDCLSCPSQCANAIR